MDRFTKRLQFNANQLNEIYPLLIKIDAIKAQWEISDKLSPRLIERLQHSVIVTSSGASTRIEGSKLTDEEVANLFKEMRIQKFKTRDEQEVAGYIELLKNVFAQWNDISLSENTILSFHNQLMKFSTKDQSHKGQYKTGSNRVEARDKVGNVIGVIFDPTPPYLTQKEVQELIDWTNISFKEEAFHSLILIANFIFEFLAIHPFQDGNGRMSRILTNLILLNSGYSFTPFISHEKLIENNKANYYLALSTAQRSWKTDNEDIMPWLRFFLKIIHLQAQEAFNILTDVRIDIYLSDKQNQVWEFAQSKQAFTRKSVIEATSLHSRTIEEAIKKLVKLKKLQRYGEGRGTYYKVIK